MSTTTERLKAVVEVESKKAQAELAALDKRIDSIGKDRTANIDVNVDPDFTGFKTELEAGLAVHTAGAGFDVRANINTSQMQQARAAISAMIPVFDAAKKSAAGAADKVDDVGEAATRAGRRAKSASGSGGIGGLNARLINGAAAAAVFGVALTGIKFAVVAAAAKPLINILVALSAGAIGLIGSLSRLSGLLATLPGFFASAAAAAFTMKAAFGGIGDALAGFKADQAGGGGGGGGGIAETMAETARKVADYERSLEDSQDRIYHAKKALEAIENALVSAQKNETEAQEALNNAREEAIEYLDDLRRSSADLANSEEAASIKLMEARRILQSAERDGGIPEKDLREAKLAVAEAEVELAEVQDERQDVSKELADADKRGIDNSVILEERQRDLADATKEVTDTEHDRLDAIREISRAEEDYQRLIEDREKLTKAANSGGGGGGSSAFGEAMKKLGPVARSFVTELLKIQAAYKGIQKEVQEVALVGFVNLAKSVQGLMPIIRTGMLGSAQIISDFGQQLADLTSTDKFKMDLGTIFGTSNVVMESMSNATVSLTKALVDLMVAAGPLTEWLAGQIEKGAKWVETTMAINRENGNLAAWFEKVKGVAQVSGTILENLFVTLKNIFGLGGDSLGNGLLQSFADITEEWRNWTGDSANQEKIRTFFADLRPVIDSVFRGIAGITEAFVKLGSGDSSSKFMKMLQEDLGPAISGLINAASNSGVLEAFIGLVVEMTGILTKLMENGSALVPIIDGFTMLAKAMKAILDIPGVTTALGYLMTALVGLKVVSVGLKFTGLTRAFGLLKGLNLAALGKVFLGFGGALKKFGAIAVRALTVLGKAFFVFGKALLTNPIFLLIAALVLLGIAIYLIYKNWDTIKEKFLIGLEYLKQKWFIVWNFIKDKFSDVWNAITDKLGGIKDALVDKAKDILTWFKELPGKMLDALGDLGEYLKEKGKDLLIGLALGYVEQNEEVATWFKDIGKRVLEYIGDLGRTLYDKGSDLLGGLKKGLIWFWDFNLKTWLNIGSKVVDAVGSLGSTLYDAGKALFEGIKKGAVWVWDNIIKPYLDLGSKITDAVGNLSEKLVQTGKDIFAGLKKGLEDYYKYTLKPYLKGIAQKIKDVFTLSWVIDSPSKVFEGYGKNLLEGLQNGLNSSLPAVEMTATKVGAAVPAAFNRGIGSTPVNTSTTNDNSVSFDSIVINGYTKSPDEIMREAYWQARTR